MKKKVLSILVLCVLALSQVACAKQENEVNEIQTETADIQQSDDPAEVTSDEEPSDMMFNNSIEEKAQKTGFDSYDEIIGLLEKDMGYAYVKVKGYDEEILLVAEGVYDNLDGNMATILAFPYLPNSSGKYICGSIISSGGTAYPISITDDGVLVGAGNHNVDGYCISTEYDSPGIMCLFTAMESFDEEANVTYCGFVRKEASLLNDDSVDIAEDDEATYQEMFNRYLDATIINFTVVE